jgi:hypothetical protein
VTWREEKRMQLITPSPPFCVYFFKKYNFKKYNVFFQKMQIVRWTVKLRHFFKRLIFFQNRRVFIEISKKYIKQSSFPLKQQAACFVNNVFAYEKSADGRMYMY